MASDTIVKFINAKNDFELLDMIRVRYQMYANDINMLSGILTGYSLDKENYTNNIRDFGKYLADLKGVNSYVLSWMEIISSEAEHPDYEIPIFFQYLDGYRQIN